MKGQCPSPLDDGGLPVKYSRCRDRNQQYIFSRYDTMISVMANMVGGVAQDKLQKQEQRKGRIISLLLLLIVAGITYGIFLFYHELPDKFIELRNYGYLGAFLISLLLNATIIWPVGNFIILFTLGGILPIPILVGLSGATGAAIGESTGYIAGYSGRMVIKRRLKGHSRLERWLARWGPVAVFALSLMPFVFDVVGIAAGAARFPYWKFLLLCWLGRTILYITIALFGAWGWNVILPYLG